MREDSVQQATVEDVYEEQLVVGGIVDHTAPLSDVVEALEYKEALRAVYVVDPGERYVGIITRSDVLGWLEHNLQAPQSRDAFPWGELGDVIENAAADDAINPRSHRSPVEPREPLEAALRKMLSAGLTVLPVVAASGDIEGELTLTRALEFALDER